MCSWNIPEDGSVSSTTSQCKYKILCELLTQTLSQVHVRHTMCRKPYGDYLCVVFVGDGVKLWPEYRTEKESWRNESYLLVLSRLRM
jgi:hypothetical protein